MRKTIALLLALLLAGFVIFTPVTQQKTFVIKSSFFNVYNELTRAGNWERWRPDIRKLYQSDSTKITRIQDKTGFTLKFSAINLHISLNGYTFNISEFKAGEKLAYSYIVVPQQLPNYTSLVVIEKTSLLRYLVGLTSGKALNETHAADFKLFMEDTDLYYGIKIIKTKVSDTNIVVLRKVVLVKNKFSEAAKSYAILKQFISSQGLKQTQPVIAQFLPKSGDSSEVNIGIPVNGKAAKGGPVSFLRMPKTGSLYIARFYGKFSDRMNVYAIVQKYFSDKQLTMPLLPFESYLDNKLPQNDSDIINIQVNFTTY
ncbi:MAG: hypothetical protein M3N14_02390 [Bacteroidota bacterium]|nr:hypothetical protein [Bacteroidota bacterium]